MLEVTIFTCKKCFGDKVQREMEEVLQHKERSDIIFTILETSFCSLDANGKCKSYSTEIESKLYVK
jgi:predicted metal-binding protein